VIKGYKKVSKYKYLGFNISTSKYQIIKDAKMSIKKNLYSIKNRISTQSQNVARALSNAFINSLLIYHMTPLFGANLISKTEIDNYEAYLKKTQLRIPNDIKTTVVRNITNWSRVPISNTIFKIYERSILKKVETESVKIPFKF
jgi:hypothetical protein